MVQSAEDKLRVEDIVGKKLATTNDRSDLEAKFKKFYQMFHAKLDTNSTYPYRSKLYMKETFKVIDTIHPIFMDMLYMKGNPFRVKGTKAQLTEQQAKVYERLMAIFFNQMNVYNSFDDFVTELLVIGTSFAKVYWEKTTKWVKKEEEVEEEEMLRIDGEQIPTGKFRTRKEKKLKEKVLTDTPKFEHISYKDIFFSTRAKDLDHTWVIHRTWKSLEQLQTEDKKYLDVKGTHLYKNLSDLQPAGELARSGDQEEYITIQEKDEIGIQLSNDAASTEYDADIKLNADGELEILEYWSADGTKLCTVAGGAVVIRYVDNPFEHGKKPFQYSNYKKRVGEIWGIGICELAEDGQDLVNTAINQAMDSNNLINNLMFIISRDAEVDTDQIKARPGGFIFVDNPDQAPLDTIIKQVQFTKVNTSEEVALGIRDINESTGASRIMQGTFESGAVRNTSQTRLLMNAGGRKFTGKVLTFDEMFFKPLVRMTYQLMQQFMTRDMVVDILGPAGTEYITVSPEAVLMDLDFIPVGTQQLVEMEQLVHQMNNFLAIASKIPMAEAVVKFRVLLRKIWRNMSTDTDTLDSEDILYTEEESKKIIQQIVGAQTGKSGGNTQPNTGGTNPSQPNLGGGQQV